MSDEKPYFDELEERFTYLAEHPELEIVDIRGTDIVSAIEILDQGTDMSDDEIVAELAHADVLPYDSAYEAMEEYRRLLAEEGA